VNPSENQASVLRLLNSPTAQIHKKHGSQGQEYQAGIGKTWFIMGFRSPIRPDLDVSNHLQASTAHG
jgi:hypothetical protein